MSKETRAEICSPENNLNQYERMHHWVSSLAAYSNFRSDLRDFSIPIAVDLILMPSKKTAKLAKRHSIYPKNPAQTSERGVKVALVGKKLSGVRRRKKFILISNRDEKDARTFIEKAVKTLG